MKVSTDKLRDGDKVHLGNAVILIQDKPQITHGRYGTWYTFTNMRVIEGKLDISLEAVSWTIQGNSTCFWRVTR